MRALGLAANNQAAVFKNLDDIMKFAAHWEEARRKLPYNTDGLAIKIRAQGERDGDGRGVSGGK